MAHPVPPESSKMRLIARLSSHPVNEEIRMKIRNIVIATSFALASGAAYAHNCPNEMKAIDAAMAKSPKLTAAQVADVKKLRAEGEALHKAGKHSESMEALGKAKKTLGI
jgi:hypothetical protein